MTESYRLVIRRLGQPFDDALYSQLYLLFANYEGFDDASGRYAIDFVSLPYMDSQNVYFDLDVTSLEDTGGALSVSPNKTPPESSIAVGLLLQIIIAGIIALGVVALIDYGIIRLESLAKSSPVASMSVLFIAIAVLIGTIVFAKVFLFGERRGVQAL